MIMDGLNDMSLKRASASLATTMRRAMLPAGATPKGTPTISVGCTGPDIVPGLVIAR